MQRLLLIVLFLVGLTDTANAEIYRGQLWKSDSGSTMKITSLDRRGNFLQVQARLGVLPAIVGMDRGEDHDGPDALLPDLRHELLKAVGACPIEPQLGVSQPVQKAFL